MTNLIKPLILFIVIALAGCANSSDANLFKNTKENFDFGWKFYAGAVEGAEALTFDDSKWRDVDLPHDWSIEGEFSKDNPSFSRGAWLPAGKVVYRKTFMVDANKKDKRFVIYFDGAYRNSEVFINGHSLGKRPLGYIAFHYDMTDYINFGEENVITVTLDNSEQPGSRWYTGTGIYRHVKLITTEKIFVPVWGNYIVADNYSDESADIKIETTVKNDFSQPKEITVKQFAIDANGNVVAETSTSKSLKANSEAKINTIVVIKNPKIWSQEKPNLYTIKTELISENKVVYEETNTTGIRTLEYSAAEGFKLNGKPTKLKGVCLHHAGGPLGAAIYERTVERQLEKLREMGCNAVRTAHNPFSEEFMDVCDRMGFLVMNECFDEWEIAKNPTTVQDGKKKRIPVKFYAHKFKEWADRDLRDFLLKDRNHPSVIMWSIGNEIKEMRVPDGIPIANRLAAIVHELDYRPVTNGVNGYNPKKMDAGPLQEAIRTSDVLGYNYILEKRLNHEQNLNPDKMSVFTEHQSAQSFYPRGTYLFGDAKKAWWDKFGYKIDEAYDWVEDRDIRGIPGMEAWNLAKQDANVSGIFIWTGWDYLGETIPFGWPARSSSFAPIDLAGFPKDGYYFYQSQWADKPMVHIFPHWNLKGMEGKKVTVYGFTNGDAVELFQDGKSLGKRKNDINSVEYQSWDVVYQPGELKAVSYLNGKPHSEKIVKTAGVPAKIKVESRCSEMKANAQDVIYVECTIVDKDGIEVPTANNKLEFVIDGPAVVAGVGNGNNMGLEKFQSNSISAFNGKALAIIKSTKETGEIKINVTSDGVEGNTIVLKSF
ncbi:glycoside hydrolase family 2 TIM barrel-domain containing protein [Seonamhaeicola sp.]|uniref:glycoside hydrolase family 2 TIM barrel-domain containing protein n=1 Tax=Seonamhaeicola sp. TaxID=1912245 RepID=UPI0026129203|nr:glycoside hydrolase family 2 TIM barrel-domain containing protein [Seonamhaeicola sp.]